MLLSIWTFGTVAALALGGLSASSGRRALLEARATLDPQDLAAGTTGVHLAEASIQLDRSHRLLTTPLLSPLRFLPVAGRQLRSAQALVTAASQTSEAARLAVGAFEAVAADPPSDGPQRVAAVAGLVEVVEDTRRRLEGVELGPTEALIPPLADARNEIALDLAEAGAQLETAGRVLTAVHEILDGPSTQLVLAANNAEMRSGAGMFLLAGPLTIADGDLTLGDLVPTGDLTLDEPVGLDPTTAALWGWTEPGREWRNLQLWPDFSRSAAIASDMWLQRTGQAVDGVIALDVAALRSLLRATGPVDTPTGTIAEDEVEELLFVEQYRALDAGTLADDERLTEEQEQRREQLGAIARAAVDKLRSGEVDLLELAGEMGTATGGRHLLFWSPSTAAQSAWEKAGVAGVPDTDSLLLGVLNRAGSKLDAHLDVEARVERDGDVVEVVVDIDYPAGLDLPPYVAGPDPSILQPPGTYVGLVSLTVPGRAGRVEVVDQPVVVAGRDGATRVAATDVVIGPGEHRSFRFRFALPVATTVTIEPSARMPAVTWATPEGDVVDDVRHTLSL